MYQHFNNELIITKLNGQKVKVIPIRDIINSYVVYEEIIIIDNNDTIYKWKQTNK